MNMRETMTIAMLSLAALGAQAAENHAKGHGQHGASAAAAPAKASAAATLPMTDAEVRKVDAKAGKLTLRHGRLENLNMAPMTMVFGVKDPAWLQTVKPGDKVRIAVDRVNGVLTVVQMKPSK
jgi:Cu(I)/Ag(I) efflux system periplasmic protein CusF